jgi:hypothetical protein
MAHSSDDSRTISCGPLIAVIVILGIAGVGLVVVGSVYLNSCIKYKDSQHEPIIQV